ncbi:MAG: hypothetical protein ACLFST_01550 [Spirochaetia bacterium]
MSELESKWRTDLSILRRQEAKITKLYESSFAMDGRAMDESVVFNLAEVKLLVAQKLIEGISRVETNYAAPKLSVESRKKINESLLLIENLLCSRNIPSPHSRRPNVTRYRVLLRLLSRYENIWIEDETPNQISRLDRKNIRIMAYAIWKFSDRDDNYHPLIDLKKLGRGTRWLLRRLFPVLLQESHDESACGIEEKDVDYHFKNTVLPLDQAVELIQEELLPAYLDKLAEDPHNKTLQKITSRLGKSLEDLKKIRMEPRGTPLIVEQNFWNEVILGTDSRGELLVTVDIPSSLNSGTNQDRTQTLVKYQILKSLSGRGIWRNFDEEVSRLKSYKSGKEGRKRDTVSVMDVEKHFNSLAEIYPVYNAVNNAAEFSGLLSVMREYGFRTAKRYIRDRFISSLSFTRSIADIKDNVLRLINDNSNR